MNSRRELLSGLWKGATILPFLAAKSQAAQDSSEEAFWRMVRLQFAFPEDKVPLNAANLCPSPRFVTDEVARLTRDVDYDSSGLNRSKFKQKLEASRQKVADQIGASPDEVALVRNTSEGNNIVNNGLTLKEGDEVVLWDQNHPTNNVAWEVRAARFGIRVKRVATPEAPTGADQLVGVFEKALSPRTKVLSLTHVSNTTGIRLPVRELCDVAHRRDIYVHVDGAQAWGALELNLAELGCDSYAASSHKWFCGPREVGMLYVRQERIPQIWPNSVAPGWGDDVDPDPVGARKFESLGQRDDARLSAVADIADLHALIGPKRIEARVRTLATTLKEEVRKAGVTVVTPQDPGLSHGVCIIDVPTANRGQVIQKLLDTYGIIASATGGLRLCPHFYNTTEHVETAIRAVRTERSLFC